MNIFKLDEIKQIVLQTIIVVCSFLSSFMGGWDKLLNILVVCMIIDYITGVIVGIYNKKLSSAIGFKGIAKKMIIVCLVGLACSADKLLGTDLLRNLTIMFYVSNEAISILENTAKLGVPYPEKLKEILIQIKDNKI